MLGSYTEGQPLSAIKMAAPPCPRAFNGIKRNGRLLPSTPRPMLRKNGCHQTVHPPAMLKKRVVWLPHTNGRGGQRGWKPFFRSDQRVARTRRPCEEETYRSQKMCVYTGIRVVRRPLRRAPTQAAGTALGSPTATTHNGRARSSNRSMPSTAAFAAPTQQLHARCGFGCIGSPHGTCICVCVNEY